MVETKNLEDAIEGRAFRDLDAARSELTKLKAIAALAEEVAAEQNWLDSEEFQQCGDMVCPFDWSDWLTRYNAITKDGGK